MKVVTLLGTRPELIKMSEIIKQLDNHTDHVFIHTGQNYDYELNEIFYGDLGLRKPDYFLECGGGTLGETIASVIQKVEEVLIKEKPDAVVILGDTNSALGGIIAKRMKIPLFHLEAGNRSFDDNVPEEINRRILDHISDVNMVYTEHSRRYLLAEGVAKERIFVMGSPMLEIINGHFKDIEKSKILNELELEEKQYILVSIHRDENIEIQSNFDELVKALNTIAEQYDMPIILSCHPRMQKKIDADKVKFDKRIHILKPFGFFDYIWLQINAKCILSDSGTISEEASVLGLPAITIRNAIERPEAIDAGTILMTGVDTNNILDCIEYVTSSSQKAAPMPVDYGVLNSSARVLKVILGYTNYINKYVWHK